ncbi:MAG: universal stress protein [Bacteroidetes bacterium]|nr:universal stress protein [Bacteroidota bacterium]
MKSLFVPTDFSPCATNAFNLALQMAKPQNAVIHLAHGFSPTTDMLGSEFMIPFEGVSGGFNSDQIAQFLKEQNDQVDTEFAKLIEIAANEGLTCKTHKINSGQFKELSEKAAELNADLIIMGTHGVKGVRETLIGSNAQRFIRTSPIPVLTVKEPISAKKIYNVVFASTFQREGESKVYADFTKLFARHPIHTYFLMVNTPNNFVDSFAAEERMHDFLKQTWPSSYSTHIHNDYSIEDGISNFSEKHNADMLIMATHGYGGLRKWVYHSTTEQIINHLSLPVLSYRLSD